jgi:hypothetical protein
VHLRSIRVQCLPINREFNANLQLAFIRFAYRVIRPMVLAHILLQTQVQTVRLSAPYGYFSEY